MKKSTIAVIISVVLMIFVLCNHGNIQVLFLSAQLIAFAFEVYFLTNGE
jgi:uncharacterized integral membrane protein